VEDLGSQTEIHYGKWRAEEQNSSTRIWQVILLKIAILMRYRKLDTDRWRWLSHHDVMGIAQRHYSDIRLVTTIWHMWSEIDWFSFDLCEPKLVRSDCSMWPVVYVYVIMSFDSAKFGSPSWISGSRSGVSVEWLLRSASLPILAILGRRWDLQSKSSRNPHVTRTYKPCDFY
jgi:hypothetical protein